MSGECDGCGWHCLECCCSPAESQEGHYFWLGREADEAPCQDTWAKLAIAYGYESDGFITVHPKV